MKLCVDSWPLKGRGIHTGPPSWRVQFSAARLMLTPSLLPVYSGQHGQPRRRGMGDLNRRFRTLP